MFPKNPYTQSDEQTELLTAIDEPCSLIVWNDEVNTFEWVIECFMTVLKHTSEQAEQLAIMIHYKGKATVKTGARSELLPLCSALLDRGLSAEVEEG
ncbi:MAG TPA: ATP-dependent Clp protease adaptor ClpS [Ferruginibacter sp.]|nr:ATP-dependent Clp protease adaptor ClpS [Ferruginibacter sp.]